MKGYVSPSCSALGGVGTSLAEAVGTVVALVVLIAAWCASSGTAVAQTSGTHQIGAMSSPTDPFQLNPVQYYATGSLFEVVFPNMPSGFQEKFLIYIPIDSVHLGPRPVLTVFHPYGQNHFDAYDDTDLIEECRARGWFCIAPLGASKKSFSSLESQQNIEIVLRCVRQAFPGWIDPTRYYAIGFSMGAGDAATYAARHLDPWKPIFAGIFLHTGSHAKAYEWNTNAGVQWVLEFWFGGTPTQAPFRYAQASTVELNPLTGMVLPGPHLGRNLHAVPSNTYVAKDDPLVDLKKQAKALVQYMFTFPGNFDFAENTADLSALPYAHSWDALDQTAALDWLAGHQLALPTEGALRADRDDQYWYFRIEQDQTDAFTDVDWRVDVAANEIDMTNTVNLDTARIPYDLVGFAAGPVTVRTSSADATADTFVLDGIASAPSAVQVNGNLATTGVDFDYDPVAQKVVLYGGAQIDVWTVTF
ncbi:alpha/beta hydrolase [Planctomycetes bacterium Pla163]